MKSSLFKTAFVVLIAISAFALMSAFSEHDPDVKANSSMDRVVGSFSKIGLSVHADVFVTQGVHQQVEVIAGKEDLEEIETHVSSGKLLIETKKPWFRRHGKIIINITVPHIEELEISGSGYIETKGAVKTQDLNLNISGSGKLRIADLSASKLKMDISGSGSIIVGGSSIVDSNEATISGSGDINVINLPVKDTKVEVSGSGSCVVYAIQKLDAEVSGSGSVRYKGTAQVSSSTSGSGKVIHQN